MKYPILFCSLIAFAGCASSAWNKPKKTAAGAPSQTKERSLAAKEGREIELEPGNFICFSLPQEGEKSSAAYFQYIKESTNILQY